MLEPRRPIPHGCKKDVKRGPPAWEALVRDMLTLRQVRAAGSSRTCACLVQEYRVFLVVFSGINEERCLPCNSE